MYYYFQFSDKQFSLSSKYSNTIISEISYNQSNMQSNKKEVPFIILSSGNKIPIIGYGTYQLRQQDCIDGTKAALKCGYTHIDTASIYRNQEQIRKAIEDSGFKRQELYITSKISPAQQGRKQSKQAVEVIIQKLGCKYLDLILIHWPGVSKLKPEDKRNQQSRLQTWQTFIQLQKEGKVKDIGVSNFLKHHLEHLLSHTKIVPSVNQFQIHPLLWQGPTIDYCRQHKIAIEAYSPLARQDDKLFKNPLMLQISKRYKKTIAQLSLKWCLQNGFIVLPKSKSSSRIQQNFNIFDFQISKEDMQKISSLKKLHVRTCWDPNNVKH